MKTFLEWLGQTDSRGMKVDQLLWGKFGDSVWLFRGIGGNQPLRKDRIGGWWSTCAYYSLGYGGYNPQRIYVAHMRKEDMQRRLDNDALFDKTIDDYPNLGFPQDPPNARLMTQREVDEFVKLVGGHEQRSTTSRPGGEQMRRALWGQECIDAVYKVMGTHQAKPDPWEPPQDPERINIVAPSPSSVHDSDLVF